VRGLEGGGRRGGEGVDEAAPRPFTAPLGRSGPLKLEEEEVEEAPRESVEAEVEAERAVEEQAREPEAVEEAIEEVEVEGLEEEAEETRPLMLEEEEAEEAEEAEAKPAEPVKVVEEKPRTYRIGDHVVQEVVVEGQPVTWIKCLLCGAEVPLTEVAKLKERPCKVPTKEAEDGEVREEKRVEPVGVCEYCGGEAAGRYPVAGMEIALCSKCLDKYEEFYLKARPSLSRRDPATNKVVTVRGRHPLELMEKPPRIAWVNELSTWFIEEGGKWPCPACGEKFDRLADAIRHFAEKHPEKGGFSREFVNGYGDVPKTWQGFYCLRCGLLCRSEEELREHYKTHGGEE